MVSIDFDGEQYNDDRLFVLHLCRGTCEAEAGGDVSAITVYHDCPPLNAKWYVVTYRNTARYPVFRADCFETEHLALSYIQKVEPTVPLVSLHGHPPEFPLPYAEFVKWKLRQGMNEYDFREMYPGLDGGRQETFYFRTTESRR